MGEKVFMQGNEAMAESAIRAGCKLFFGYPITPSSEVPEYYAAAMHDRPEENIMFIQAETEVAAFNMVAGAAATGHRAMTATSGPGFDLGQEAMSYMSAGDIPSVIVEVQRPGPGDGEILAAQGDYFSAVKGGGHGDYNNLVLAPYSVQEMCELMQECFDLAQKYLNPVILLTDATLAKMRESVVLPDYKEIPNPKDVVNALTGKKDREAHKVVTCGDGAVQWEEFNDKLQEKYKKIAKNEVRYDERNTDDADIILVAYGSVARVCESAMKMAREQGIKVGMIRPISLWPFPDKAFEGKKNKKYLVVELSAGQMVQDVKLAVDDKKDVFFFGKLGGTTPSPKNVLDEIIKLV